MIYYREVKSLKSISEQLLDIGGIRNKVIHEGDRDITEKQMRKYLLDAETLVLGTDAKQGLIVNLSRLFRNNGNFFPRLELVKIAIEDSRVLIHKS